MSKKKLIIGMVTALFVLVAILGALKMNQKPDLSQREVNRTDGSMDADLE